MYYQEYLSSQSSCDAFATRRFYLLVIILRSLPVTHRPSEPIADAVMYYCTCLLLDRLKRLRDASIGPSPMPSVAV